MAKYDWAKLKKEFMLGDCKSVREFAKTKGIPYESIKPKSKGWTEEKHRKNTANATQITEAVAERQIQYEIDRNSAHLATGDLIMAQINAALHGIRPKDKNALYLIQAAAASLEKIQKIQRLGENTIKANDNGILAEILEYLNNEEESGQ